MKNALEILTGKRVVHISEYDAHIQIQFDDNSTLDVFNRFKLTIEGNHDIGHLVGRIVKKFECDKRKIEIQFWPTARLVIGIENSDYNGPEALVFVPESGSTVVWN